MLHWTRREAKNRGDAVHFCCLSSKYLNYPFVWLKNVAARKQKKQTQKVSVSLLSASDCYISRKGLEAFPAIPCCNVPVQSQVITPNWVVCEEIPFYSFPVNDKLLR